MVWILTTAAFEIHCCTTVKKTADLSTVRNEVAKVMFLQVCVCPQQGSASVHVGIHPPETSFAPGSRLPPPREQTPHLGSIHPPRPGSPQEQTPPPRRWLLLRTGRILLECILFGICGHLLWFDGEVLLQLLGFNCMDLVQDTHEQTTDSFVLIEAPPLLFFCFWDERSCA